MNPIGLYIHVPFCDGKCPYCDFYSININNDLMDKYTYAIIKQIIEWSKKLNCNADTLYFGGGTPSLLGEERLIKIVNAVKERFKLNPDNSEVTIEANPTKGKGLDFYRLRKAGINRLSIGLQSANNDELLLLGRKHSSKDAYETIKMAQNAGFDNISVDLMIAIQGQTKNSLLNSIDFCSNLNIQHISAYMLKIEPGTSYYKNYSSLNLPDEDLQSEMYLFTCENLSNYGFRQYEISNFCKDNNTSKHNLKYWNCDEYLGLGPSAHSFIDNKRFYYKPCINDFICDPNTINDGLGGDIEEYSMLRLRLCEGLINREFMSRFNCDIPQNYYSKCNLFQGNGLLNFDKDSIRLTPKGFLLSNQLIGQIIT